MLAIVSSIFFMNANPKSSIWDEDLTVTTESPFQKQSSEKADLQRRLYDPDVTNFIERISTNNKYAGIVVDLKTNTITVYLKEATETEKNDLENTYSIPDVSIVYKSAKATKEELREWKSIIKEEKDELETRGVKISLIGILSDGYIYCLVEDLTEEKTGIIREVLQNKVPLGIVKIQSGKCEGTGYTDQHEDVRPVRAGTMGWSYSEKTPGWGPSVTGWYVSWNS